jgi:hypothetical protein
VLAALQIVVIPSAIIEPAISRNIDKRWHDTFAFGLIHGSVSRRPSRSSGYRGKPWSPALAAFNLGVKVEQVAIVCLVMPALIGLDSLSEASRGSAKPVRTRSLVYALSGMIAVLGSYWTLERTILA